MRLHRITPLLFVSLLAAGQALSAVRTWTGLSATTGNWTDAGNWDALPAAGDDLVFPNGAARLANTNDFAAGTLFSSLAFNGVNYNITGNAIQLAAGITTNVPFGAGGDVGPRFDPDITLTAPQSFVGNGARGVSLRGTLDPNGASISVSGVANLSIDGDVIGSTFLTKSGTGRLFLTGNSTFTGGILVTGGTISARSSNALGAPGPGNRTLVNPGASLTIGSGSTIPEDVVLTGLGNGVLPTLSNEGGNSAIAGTVTLNGSVSVGVGSGTLDLRGPLVDGGGTGLLTKLLPGELILSGAAPNSYTGDTFVFDGTLRLSKAAGPAIPAVLFIGDGSGAASTAVVRETAGNQIADTSAVSVAADGLLDMNGQNDVIGSLAGTGAVAVGGAAQLTAGGTNATTTFSGVISGTGFLTKFGTGTLTLSGSSSNTFTGVTLVSDGTLALQKSGGAIAVAGTLAIGDNLGPTGSVVARELTSDNIADTATVNINVDGLLEIGAGLSDFVGGLLGSGSVNLSSGHLGIGGVNSSTNFSGVITGAGGSLTKTGVGNIILAGAVANSYTGTTRVDAGTLTLSKGAGIVAVPGSLVVGDGAGAANSAVVREAAAGQIADASAVSVATDGLLDLNGQVDEIGSLAGTGNVALGGVAVLLAGGTNATTTFSGVISGTGALNKLGTGTLTLSGTSSNTYSSTTLVADGTLALQKTGGAIAIAGFLAIGNNVGAPGSAVLRELTSDNIADASGLNIGPDGLLEIGAGLSDVVGALGGVGNVNLGTGQLGVGGGNASSNFSGVITGAGGSLTKTGAGNVVLSGAVANTYTGTTTVLDGTLTLAKSLNIVAVPGPLVVGDGIGAASSAVARQVNGNQLPTTSTVALASDGLFDDGGAACSIASLTGVGRLAIGGTFGVGLANASFTFGGTFATSGGGGLFKGGTGTMTLTGPSPVGKLFIVSGTVDVQGTVGPVNLFSALLVGTGTVGAISATGGTLSPGALLGTGTLTSTGGLSLSASSAMTVDLNGAAAGQFDRLAVTGPVSLGNATLQPFLGFSPAPGTIFTLVDNDGADPVAGTFSGRPEGSTFLLGSTIVRMSYVGGDGNDVTLAAIDPATLTSVSVRPAQVLEGNAGVTRAIFEIVLSNPNLVAVTMTASTADGTAKAIEDYRQTIAAITFAPGETFKTVVVDVFADTTVEPDETFRLRLSNVVNAAVVTPGEAAGLILNDDLPALSVGSVTVAEGNAGTTAAVFPVTLSAPFAKTVSVGYATANGTASAGTDYVAATGTVSFAPGDTSKTITVLVNGDTAPEAGETFTLTLSGPTNAVLGAAVGTGTIANDDAATLSIGNVSVTEGNAGTSAAFTVTLSPASAQTVTVAFATADGTATAGSDYTAASGTLTFEPGETTKTIPVAVIGDTAFEPNETFSVTLSGPTNASLVAATGSATLVNDDTAAGGCSDGSTTALCVLDQRFRITVDWKNPYDGGSAGVGTAARLTDTTGTFWFFGPSNIELVVKMLDGRATNGKFWLLLGSLTDVEFTLRITDSVSGTVKTYVNQPRTLGSFIDLSAFSGRPEGSSLDVDTRGLLQGVDIFGDEGELVARLETPLPLPLATTATPGEAAACATTPQALCLASGRFQATVSWRNQFAGTSGAGTAVSLTSDSGFFWFFDEKNVELVLKVLDGRSTNGKFWVLYGALSDVEYTVTVTDTQTGAVKTYVNPAGKISSVIDTSAF